jgi:hypothetical protein
MRPEMRGKERPRRVTGKRLGDPKRCVSRPEQRRVGGNAHPQRRRAAAERFGRAPEGGERVRRIVVGKTAEVGEIERLQRRSALPACGKAELVGGRMRPYDMPPA